MNSPDLKKVFNILFAAYGPQRWWPGDGQFEIILGAILTQNTAWHNAALAISNLAANDLIDPAALSNAPPEHVKSLLAPAGYFNVKYKRIRNFLEFLARYNMELEQFSRLPTPELRRELLEVNGVGPETADSILLYAFEQPIFVVDAYLRRLFSRLGYHWMEKAPYDEIQAFFMEQLKPDVQLYNEYHALVVTHCKEACKKKTPFCLSCRLASCCDATAKMNHK